MNSDTSIHSLGCSIFRTGRCTCAYQAQWDSTPEEEPGLAGKGTLQIPLADGSSATIDLNTMEIDPPFPPATVRTSDPEVAKLIAESNFQQLVLDSASAEPITIHGKEGWTATFTPLPQTRTVIEQQLKQQREENAQLRQEARYWKRYAMGMGVVASVFVGIVFVGISILHQAGVL